jgi:hypothetical protein
MAHKAIDPDCFRSMKHYSFDILEGDEFAVDEKGIAKGDPDEVGVIRGAAWQVLETILPAKD